MPDLTSAPDNSLYTSGIVLICRCATQNGAQHEVIVAPGLVPTREELRANFRVLMLWRWTTGAGALALAGFGALMPGTEFVPLTLVAVGLLHLVFNAAVWYALRRSDRTLVPLAYAQTTLDLASLLMIFHFTGGVESPCIIYFVIHLFGTALILSAPASALLALGATR